MTCSGSVARDEGMQEENDGLEEGRSDPEGRGARGPARPTCGRAGKKSTNELVQDVRAESWSERADLGVGGEAVPF